MSVMKIAIEVGVVALSALIVCRAFSAFRAALYDFAEIMAAVLRR